MINFPFYKQYDTMDCGPTCLRMIAKYYKRNISLEQLRKYSNINRDGVSFLGISQAAEQIGFKSVGVKITYQQLLEEVPKPCIVHWNQNHFVVVTPNISSSNVIIADPGEGRIKLRKADFLEAWMGPGMGVNGRGLALLLEPTPRLFSDTEEKKKGIGFTFLSSYLFKYKVEVFQLVLSLLIGSIFQLIFPFLTQSIVDTGINTQNLNFVQIILIAQFALFLSRTVIEFIRSRILLFLSTHINLSILSDFWTKLMRLPISFFDVKQVGDIVQRISDHHRLESFMTGTALQTLFSFFSILIYSIVLLFFSKFIFLMFLIGSVLYFIWISLFLKFRRNLDYKKFSVASKENSVTMQMIQGMQEIKLNNAEHLKRWKWEGIQTSLFKLNFRSLTLSQYQQAGAIFLSEGKNLVITYVVAKLVLEGQVTLGGMLAIQYIIGQMNAPVEQLISFTQQAQDAKISLERLNEIHEMEDEEPADKVFIDRVAGNYGISLKNVSFTYPGAGNQLVLKNLDVLFPSGKITAIVGMSGSGKTTVLKLIQKFYDNYSGDILVGESNLNFIRPFYWRTLTGSVMQDGFIFSETIERNIAVGEEYPDYDRLIQACKIANILNFIESLPLSYNTKIGAEGNGLSAGQKQRILIARAVYKDPKIILFDEATNALDANNEKEIMGHLQNFFQGRTAIIVAHRLSTVRNADKIVVLEGGQVIEQGTHDELAKCRGKYYELVKNQLELGN